VDGHGNPRPVGVQRAYWDVSGRLRRPPPEAVHAVERALDADPHEPPPAVEPVVVAWDGRLRVRLRARRLPDRVACAVLLEDGTELGWRVVPTRELPDDQAMLRLPELLPLGAHRLRLAAGRERWQSVVLSAPRRLPAVPAPGWGVWVPSHALWSQKNGGPDFEALRRAAAWLREQGGGVLGTLPLYAGLLDEPCEPSPYLPASRLFWNELLVHTGGGSPRSGGPLDYRQAFRDRRTRLLELWRACGDRERQEVEAWAAGQPWLTEYAAFRALLDLQRRPWRQWPEPHRGGLVPEGSVDPDARGLYTYAQWLAGRQLERVAFEGVWVYLDLPLGVHPDGFDAWRFRGLFADGVTVGAPPDPFSARGQDWGFAPPHPHRVREDGYAYLRACLARAFSVAKMLRLDHVMALHRLYWIPQGFSAAEGVYVRYPAEELYAAVMLEAARAGAVVVGEDLGTVPNEVRRELDKRGFWRMYVLLFELVGPGAREPGRNTVASLGTHDTPTFAGFWEGLDIAERERLLGLGAEAAQVERLRRASQVRSLARWLGVSSEDPRGALRALFRWLGRSPAACVLASVEDLWGETERHHLPGTPSHAYANWRRRMRYALEDWTQSEEVREVLAELRRARSAGG